MKTKYVTSGPKDRDGAARSNAGPKKSENIGPRMAAEAPPPGRVPQAVRQLMEAAPPGEWAKIRAFLIESEEEGELLELLPDMNRVMKFCPPRLVGRVPKREVTGDELDWGYMRLHDAIHGVRTAIYSILHLAGFRDHPMPPSPKTAASADRAASGSGGAKVEGIPGEGSPALATRSGKN